jgi:hypothetical protein
MNATTDEPNDKAPLYDEQQLKQLEDDDPGISWLETVRKTLPLVNGTWGKARALGKALIRLLP